MGARDDHGPDTGLGEAGELPGDALHGAARLGVGVEQVARDEKQVHLLGEGQVNAGAERGELALALGSGGIAKVRVARTEMDVRGVEDSQHAVGNLPVRSIQRRVMCRVLEPALAGEVGCRPGPASSRS